MNSSWLPSTEPEHSVPRFLYSKRDAACALSISERTLHELIKAGQLPTVRIARRVMVSTEAIRNFITAREGQA
jgi:predicted site-specific integrase-resolvase